MEYKRLFTGGNATPCSPNHPAPPTSSEYDSYMQAIRLYQDYGIEPLHPPVEYTLPVLDTSPTPTPTPSPSPTPSQQLTITQEPTHTPNTTSLIPRNTPQHITPPQWHAPWKLMRVISGHLQWVRCVSVDPTNQWFATGSSDRTIKIWDLASGSLKLTLTGHIHAVRDLVVSQRHPYLFSVGEDKTVRCWDLEQNKVIRYYHGHLSGVYTCALHPTLDVLVSGGRDSSARVWDIRTKKCVHVLTGHSNTIASVQCQSSDPQIVTGSHDTTVRSWDLRTGGTMAVLTHHKKSVRSVLIHPEEYSFCSASSDALKVWKCPEGRFLRNIPGHKGIVESMAVNQDNVLVAGGLDGSIGLFDWKSGYKFQSIQSKVQPGSMDCEAGVLACAFDKTGSRLITCESDKTIKIWKEDGSATPQSHPVDMASLYNRRIERY